MVFLNSNLEDSHFFYIKGADYVCFCFLRLLAEEKNYYWKAFILDWQGTLLVSYREILVDSMMFQTF